LCLVRRPETFLVSPRIDPLFTDDDAPIKADISEHLYCAICMETVPGTLKFTVRPCGHDFCSSCVAEYVAVKLGENLARVECPDPSCGGVGAVEPDSCRGIISSDLLDKWGLLLCESALGAKKVYCPYKECSAPLLADGDAGAAAIVEAECPHCHRLFCARCAAPWHAEIGCREFQQLGQDERGREDLLLRQLAGRKMWQRCPKCQMYVEKSEGCNYIKCRYSCAHWTELGCTYELLVHNRGTICV
jgi:E3 ubiquitin-protein ligase RNF144